MPRYFKPSEFDAYERIDTRLLYFVDEVRDAFERPININSDYRAPSKDTKRSLPSLHESGRALDIAPVRVEESISRQRIYSHLFNIIAAKGRHFALRNKPCEIQVGIYTALSHIHIGLLLPEDFKRGRRQFFIEDNISVG